jgi:O-antigen/teichoic acid export membrane protein
MMLAKIKELTKDTAVYGLSTIVGRFLNFLLVPYYTNVLAPDALGVYSNVYAYLAFMNIVYLYGTDVAFMKYAAFEKSSKKTIFSTAYLSVFATSVFLTLILLAFRAPLENLTRLSGGYEDIFPFVVFVLYFDAIAVIPFANLRLERKTTRFALIKLANILINLGLNILFISYFKMGIKGIFLANLIASAFTFVAVLPEIFRYFDFSFNFPFWKKILKFGLPYLPASMAAMLVQVADRPILLELQGKEAVGIYSANYKLGIFMMLFVSMFQYAWQPFYLNNAKEPNAKNIFAKVMTIFLVVASVIWITLSLFIDDIVRIEILSGRYFIGENYWSGTFIVPMILLAYVFNGINVNLQAGFYIEEKTKYLPVVTFVGAAINIISNLLLIPVYGIFGAALATLFSYAAMSLVSFTLTRKFYPIKYEYGKIVSMLLLLAVATVGYYTFFADADFSFASKLLILAGYVVLMFAFKIVNATDLKYLGKLLGISKAK